MSHFDYAIPTILQHEGGFVDDPHDCGGATNYGISLRWLQRCQELLIRGEHQPTEVTVDTIRDQAWRSHQSGQRDSHSPLEK